MKKLFLVVLCSMPLLSAARAEDGKMKSGDSMQQGDAMKADDAGRGGTGSMAPDSTGTYGEEAERTEKKNAGTKMQDDGMKPAGAMQHDDKMDDGKTK